MFTLTDGRPDRTCQGFSRRDFLRVGGLALGGLTLADLLSLRAAAGESGPGHKSVVLLFLQGGPPQIETFDPKMSAPDDVRSATGEIPTALPGITFGSTFPKLAERLNRVSVVRSFQSRNGGHNYDPITTGGNGAKASMSAMYSYLAGSTHPETSLPTNILLLPEAVQEGLKLKSNFETGALPTLTQTGALGPAVEAFNPVGGTQLRKAMEMRLPRDRFDDRRALLKGFDDLRRDLDSRGVLERADKVRQQAFDIIVRGITDAFDLNKEDAKTVARYDTAGLFKMDDWTKFVNMNRTSNLLGRQMLLARRLCEAGCGFVTVSDCGWDLHADGNSAKGMTAMEVLGRQVDHAVAAFLDDVRERGLEDRILLVVTGEMGRTPKRNKAGGRDHWGDLTPLLMAGGKITGGRVLGQSDAQGGRPASEPYGPPHLFATVMDHLFDLARLRLRTDLGRDLKAAVETPAIEALYS